MLKGTVKWFNDTKGYGFITSDEGGDTFVHFSGIQAVGADGRRSLNEGDVVEYEVQETPRGMQAVKVRVRA